MEPAPGVLPADDHGELAHRAELLERGDGVGTLGVGGELEPASLFALLEALGEDRDHDGAGVLGALGRDRDGDATESAQRNAERSLSKKPPSDP